MVAELSALRDQIDAVDKALLDLLANRMALVEEVGAVKSRYGLPIYVLNEKRPCWPRAAKKLKCWGCRRI